MRKLSLIVAAGLAQPLLTFSPTALAETSASNTPIVVSASRLEQPVNRVGSSVVVLSGDELRERGVKYVYDALLEVPSVLLTTLGSRGSQTQIRMRGNEANHVLVLIDGMRMSDASTAELDLASLTLEGVEKIEVLMGPQSTLYGNDAAAGVINITTIKGKEGFGGNVNVTAGSLGTRSADIQLNGAKSGWHYMITASDFTTDGISAANEKNGNTEEDGFEHDTVKLKAGYDHDAFQTWVVFNQSDSRYEFDDWVTQAVDSLTNYQESELQGASWAIAAPAFNDRLHHQLQFSNTTNDTDNHGSFGVTVNQTDRDVIDFQGRFTVTDNHTLQYGAESIDETLESGTSNWNVGITGTYLQWLMNFGRVDITLGARSDDHDTFGRHGTHRATISYQLDDAWRVRGAYGTGFKAPTLSELYNDAFSSNNPLLKPEETKSHEVGIEYRANNLNTSLTLFDQETTNLIRFSDTFKLENLDKADSRGVELNLGTNWDQFEIDSAFTWIDASETDENGVEGERLRIPDFAANITVNYLLSEGRIWGQARYRDEILDIGSNTVPDYWLFHIGASYDVCEDITVSGRIENLADEDYEEVFSYGARGRTGSVSVDWRF